MPVQDMQFDAAKDRDLALSTGGDEMSSASLQQTRVS